MESNCFGYDLELIDELTGVHLPERHGYNFTIVTECSLWFCGVMLIASCNCRALYCSRLWLHFVKYHLKQCHVISDNFAVNSDDHCDTNTAVEHDITITIIIRGRI